MPAILVLHEWPVKAVWRPGARALVPDSGAARRAF
jgi:hypothetical protein